MHIGDFAILNFRFLLQSPLRCRYYWPKHPYVPAIQGVLTFFVIANFSLATFMDPGVIPKGEYILNVNLDIRVCNL